jgi:hypothetical protein
MWNGGIKAAVHGTGCDSDKSNGNMVFYLPLSPLPEGRGRWSGELEEDFVEKHNGGTSAALHRLLK